VILPFALLLAACGPGEQRALDQAMAPPRAGTDPASALAGCAALEFEEMRVLCHIELAAQAGAAGDPTQAERACAQVPSGTWAHECHFRAGEELGRSGHPAEAVAQCAQADRFARFCITHAAWAMPPEPSAGGQRPADELVLAMDARVRAIEVAAQGLEPQLRPEAVDTFRMALWFGAYFGTGHADPRVARAASPDQLPQARTAFMVEASRLLWPPDQLPEDGTVERLLAAWQAEGDAATGDPLPTDQRHGRYSVPLPAPCERDLQPVPLYGGGRRLLGASDEEDLTIAALEALFFRPDATMEHFMAWARDPRDRVRWTAARLARLSEPREGDGATQLSILGAQDDSCVAWHAKDALGKARGARKHGGTR
jgi:hypothetical protein